MTRGKIYFIVIFLVLNFHNFLRAEPNLDPSASTSEVIKRYGEKNTLDLFGSLLLGVGKNEDDNHLVRTLMQVNIGYYFIKGLRLHLSPLFLGVEHWAGDDDTLLFYGTRVGIEYVASLSDVAFIYGGISMQYLESNEYKGDEINKYLKRDFGFVPQFGFRFVTNSSLIFDLGFSYDYLLTKDPGISLYNWFITVSIGGYWTF